MLKHSLHIAQLLAKAQKGDQLAFQEIYELYYDRLLRFGCSMGNSHGMVHDVIQELFIRLLQQPNRFLTITNLDTYLFKCLRRNLGSSLQRARKKRNQAYKHRERQQIEMSVETRLIHSEYRKAQSAWLSTQLDLLTPHQKESIYLRFYENLSYDEMAEIFSVSNQVVRNSVFRALKKLRKNISKQKTHPLSGLYGLFL
ncbi:MAG: RNA polymerase sigma factor [Bacteroidota bacterium]